MMKFILFLALISFNFLTNAQTSFKNHVMIFPVSKPVIIKFKGEEKELKSSFVFNEIGEIEIIKGKISLLTVIGKEFTFGPGKKIKVSKISIDKNSLPLDKMSKYINKPALYFPNLYSSTRANNVIFPIQSKVVRKETVRFYLSEEDHVKGATFKLFESSTKSLVWQTHDFINKFKYENLPIIKGEKYYWKLYNECNSTKGTIELLSKEQLREIKIVKPRTKEDYVNVFFTFIEHKCFFDAMDILKKANEKFPNDELFKILESKLSAFRTQL